MNTDIMLVERGGIPQAVGMPPLYPMPNFGSLPLRPIGQNLAHKPTPGVGYLPVVSAVKHEDGIGMFSLILC